jgi:hypothetical protein
MFTVTFTGDSSSVQKFESKGPNKPLVKNDLVQSIAWTATQDTISKTQNTLLFLP